MRKPWLLLSLRSLLTLSLQHGIENDKIAKVTEQVIVDAYTQAIAKAWKKENDGLCTPFGSLDIELENGKTWSISQGAAPLLKLCDQQISRDPHELIRKFIEEKAKYQLQVLSRPVNDVARALMCLGKGVGKGFDIKSKSSKIKEEVNGYVPICQQCLDSEFINNELTSTVSTMKLKQRNRKNEYFEPYDLFYNKKHNKFALTSLAASLLETNVSDGGSCPLSELREKVVEELQKQMVVPYCKTYNFRCYDPSSSKEGEQCYHNFRAPLSKFQAKSYHALEKPNEVSGGDPAPAGIRQRTCVTMTMNEMEKIGSVPVPFLAYELESGTKMPIVSDYDLLLVAECKSPYNMYNGDDRYYKQVENMVELMTDCIQSTQLSMPLCLWGGEMSKYSQAIDLYESPEDMLKTTGRLPNIGLHPSSFAQHVLAPLIDGSNDEKNGAHGAVRHGPENQNLGGPQEFEDAPYPWWDTNGKVENIMPMANMPLGTSVRSAMKKLLVKESCCAMINPWWLSAQFHKCTDENTKWIELWEAAASNENLQDCPFFKDSIKTKFKELIEAIKTEERDLFCKT